MPSWLDRIPSHERAKIRQRLRSPEEYEKLREKVKGPEDLEREMSFNEGIAELNFAMETEPHFRNALREQVHEDLREEGIDAVFNGQYELSPGQRVALEQGNFQIGVEAHPETHQDTLMVFPEGNVQEKLPVKTSFTEQYVSQFQKNM